jgi:hypothetical protein
MRLRTELEECGRSNYTDRTSQLYEPSTSVIAQILEKGPFLLLE